MPNLDFIYQNCKRCKGSGTEDHYEIVIGEEVFVEGVVCSLCNGDAIKPVAGLSSDLIDLFNDMNDKINDIFEKINES